MPAGLFIRGHAENSGTDNADVAATSSCADAGQRVCRVCVVGGIQLSAGQTKPRGKLLQQGMLGNATSLGRKTKFRAQDCVPSSGTVRKLEKKMTRFRAEKGHF